MKKVLAIVLACILLLSVFPIAVNAATKPVPGYYVVGTMNNWTIDKDYLMSPSNFDNHYELLQVSLQAGDELKIVYSDDGIRRTTWYPTGVENNYIVEETSLYYNIELAPDYDGEGDYWYADCIKAMPCTPPTDVPDPTEPEPRNLTKELWESGADLTAEDIEEAANIQHNSRTYFYADKIKLWNSYRFNCTPAYVVDYDVEGYGYYAMVVLEEYFGDYLLWSSSSYEPSIFADDQLYTFTKAYKAGVLTEEMLAELAEAEYKGRSYGGKCGLLTRNIKGDADGSGDVDIIDATVIQRADARIIGDGDFYKPLGDVDGDGNANVIDATLIQRHNVGLYSFE